METSEQPEPSNSSLDVARELERQQRDEHIAAELDQAARAAEALGRRTDPSE